MTTHITAFVENRLVEDLKEQCRELLDTPYDIEVHQGDFISKIEFYTGRKYTANLFESLVADFEDM